MSLHNIIFVFVLISVSSCMNVKKQYYDNGQLKFKAYYNNGQLDGKVLRFYKNGQIKSKAFYENGTPIKTCKQFYKNGQLKLINQFTEGKVEGELKKYHKNGKLKLKANFKNGYVNGKVSEHYKNGQLKRKAIEKDSIVYFEQKYSKDGKLIGEFRKIKAKAYLDTLNLSEQYSITVKPNGPVNHYDTLCIKILEHNVHEYMKGFKKDFEVEKEPKMRLVEKNEDIEYTGDIPPKEKWKYEVRAYHEKVVLDSNLGYFPVKENWIKKYCQVKDSFFNLTFKPKDTGQYLLIGNYFLSPTDTAPVKSVQKYPFSVRFHVKP